MVVEEEQWRWIHNTFLADYSFDNIIELGMVTYSNLVENKLERGQFKWVRQREEGQVAVPSVDDPYFKQVDIHMQQP